MVLLLPRAPLRLSSQHPTCGRSSGSCTAVPRSCLSMTVVDPRKSIAYRMDSSSDCGAWHPLVQVH